jgi:hypothetical protein
MKTKFNFTVPERRGVDGVRGKWRGRRRGRGRGREEMLFLIIIIVILVIVWNTMKFKRRYGEFEQGCVSSKSYTAPDALLPTLPACRQPFLPACVIVTRHRSSPETLFVREQICS